MKITSGKAQIAAESSGSGEPTVLLIHAGVTDRRSWRDVVGRLPDHRCLTYDARGYGLTGRTRRRTAGRRSATRWPSWTPTTSPPPSWWAARWAVVRRSTSP